MLLKSNVLLYPYLESNKLYDFMYNCSNLSNSSFEYAMSKNSSISKLSIPYFSISFFNSILCVFFLKLFLYLSLKLCLV